MSARTGQPGLSLGDVLAGAGSLLLLASLWRPWYELRIPDEVLAQVRAFSSRMGELGPYAQQGIDQFRAQGALPVTGWEAFEQADTMLAVIAGLVLGVVVLTAVGALSARLDGALVLAGLVAAATVLLRIASPPGSDLPIGAELLHPATGAWIALAGALLMAGGGIVAATGQGARAPATPPAQPLPAHEFKIWDAS